MSTLEQPTPSDGCAVAHDFDPFSGTPQPFFAKARAERPVFFHEGLRAYVLTRYEDCRRLLGDRTGAVSANAALLGHLNVEPLPQAWQILQESGFEPGPSIVDVDGDAHKLQRTVTQPPFSPNRVKPLAEFIRRQVGERLDAVAGAGQVDIVEAMIYEVPATVILHMMGVPDEQLGMVKGFRGPWAIFIWGNPDEEVQLQTARMMGAFGQWARGIVADRTAHPGADIISETIANLREKGELENNRLFVDSYTLNVVMAGHETTTNTMSGGLVSLLLQPDQWAAIVADHTLIPNAVEEMLRHSTGVPTWRQRAVRDLEFSGVTVPAGSVVYAAITSANRDEEIFGADSDRFDIRRDSASKHIAFGIGAHTCMGNHLATLEMEIMLEELATRFPRLSLVPGQHLEYSPNTSQRGPERVLVDLGAARPAMS